MCLGRAKHGRVYRLAPGGERVVVRIRIQCVLPTSRRGVVYHRMHDAFQGDNWAVSDHELSEDIFAIHLRSDKFIL